MCGVFFSFGVFLRAMNLISTGGHLSSKPFITLYYDSLLIVPKLFYALRRSCSLLRLVNLDEQWRTLLGLVLA